MPGYELLKQDDSLNERDQSRSTRSRRIGPRFARTVLFVTTGLFIYLGLSTFRFPWSDQDTEPETGTLLEHDVPLKQCPSNLPPPATPPAQVNLWAGLAISETVDVTKWLSNHERGLNLTLSDQGALSDNIIFHIEAYRPPKADALRYLTSPSDQNLPEKFARVTIHHGSAPDPYIMDYLVGPLPVSSKTSIRELNEIYHRNPIPYNARGYTARAFGELEPLMEKIMKPISGIVKVYPLFNFWPDCLFKLLTYRNCLGTTHSSRQLTGL